MSYHDQLKTALSYAPIELARSAGIPSGMVQPDGTVTYPNKVDHSHSQSDSALLPYNYDRQTPLNSVAVTYPEEMTELLAAAVDVVGVSNYDIPGRVAHEEGHLEVLRARGITSCQFEVRMLKVALSRENLARNKLELKFLPSALATNVRIPRIILAGMHARPIDPSPGDLAAIRSYGYQGIQDVGSRLIRYSQQRRSRGPVLLPLSYVEVP